MSARTEDTTRAEPIFRGEPGVWWRLAPALLIVIPLFVVAVGLAVLQSVGIFGVTGSSDPSLAAYRSLLGSAEFWRSLSFSAYLATVATTLSLIIGVAAALTFRRFFSRSRVWSFLLQMNLAIPHLVGALAMLLVLGQSGLLSRGATAVGLTHGTSGFPAFVFDSRGLAIIAEYVWKEAPFFAVVALAILGTVATDYDSVAATLGAGRPQRFRYVTLPLLLPALVPAAVVVFAFSFGTFEVPLLLGGSFPEALPVLAYRRFVNVDLAARPEAMAAGVIIIIVGLAAAVAYQRLARRLEGRR
ncbi:MAG: ABC transporter permease subunit [Acidimicrobiia bacterium]